MRLKGVISPMQLATAARYPTRHPVIAYDFDTPLIKMSLCLISSDNEGIET